MTTILTHRAFLKLKAKNIFLIIQYLTRLKVVYLVAGLIVLLANFFVWCTYRVTSASRTSLTNILGELPRNDKGGPPPIA